MSDEPAPTDPVSVRAQMDQMGAMLVELAPTMASFKDALMVNGFSSSEAVQLVEAWMCTTIGGGR